MKDFSFSADFVCGAIEYVGIKSEASRRLFPPELSEESPLFFFSVKNSVARGVRLLFCRPYNSVDVDWWNFVILGPVARFLLDFTVLFPCYEPKWNGYYSEKYRFSLWRNVVWVSLEIISHLISFCVITRSVLAIWRAEKSMYGSY